MRFAVVSDIHANILALEAFLGRMRDEGIDLIFNLGDSMQIGPYPREVSDCLRSDRRFVSVLGNNDLVLFERDLYEGKVEIDDGELRHQEWTIGQLGSRRIEELKDIPSSREVAVGDRKLLLAHSRVHDSISLPLLYQGRPLGEMDSDYGPECDLVMFGHTHLKALIETDTGRHFVNPGSLGCSGIGKGSYAIITMEGDRLEIGFGSVDFDVQELRRELCRKEVPARERIMRSFF